MRLPEEIRDAINISSISFLEREDCIYRGLLVYLSNAIGDYLNEEQIVRFAQVLRRFRNREAHVEYSEELCDVISEETDIRNRYIPRKSLRKDEASMLIYNVSPYALLSRNNTAMMAKALFPNFFASAATINSTFTKFYRVPGSSIEPSVSLSIVLLPDHNVNTVETVFYELGLKSQI